MKLFNRNQIEALSKFSNEDFLTASFYLETDKGRLSKKEISLSFKNLLSHARTHLEEMDLSKEKKESLSQDLEKIARFGSKTLISFNSPGLAVFSCSAGGFWQVFHLPDAPRNRVIFDRNPYIRPLSAILDEYHSICAVVVDRREAKWYEILMGEISLLDSLSSDVPSKVREGGWEGYESKRIERHIAAHLQDHFKKVSNHTFALFKKNRFDWLFLGYKEEYWSDLEPLLHPYLTTRLKARLKSGPADSENMVLKESVTLEKKLKRQEEEDLVSKLVSELEKGGRAVSGAKEVLRRINRGEIQTLVVTRNFSKEGKLCSKCHFLYVDELRCPSCQVKTNTAVDIIDEAVESAMKKNSLVKHVTAPTPLDRFGKIGAFLRYKSY